MKTETESLIQSESGPATCKIDVPLIVSGLFYWTALMTALAMAAFAPSPRAMTVTTGTARINCLGDVVGWQAEEAMAKSERDALYRNFFRLLPEGVRAEALDSFTRGVLGPPYRFHKVLYTDGKARVKLEFEVAGDDVYLVRIEKRT